MGSNVQTALRDSVSSAIVRVFCGSEFPFPFLLLFYVFEDIFLKRDQQ